MTETTARPCRPKETLFEILPETRMAQAAP